MNTRADLIQRLWDAADFYHETADLWNAAAYALEQADRKIQQLTVDVAVDGNYKERAEVAEDSCDILRARAEKAEAEVQRLTQRLTQKVLP